MPSGHKTSPFLKLKEESFEESYQRAGKVEVLKEENDKAKGHQAVVDERRIRVTKKWEIRGEV